MTHVVTRTLRSFAAGIGLLLACSASHAVEVAALEDGEALIVPVWSAAEGNQTLLTVTNNDGAEAMAVKVRVLSGLDGSELYSFNLYLNRGAIWVAAIHGEGGTTRLETPDSDCIVPVNETATVAELGANYGSIEIVAMGVVQDESVRQLVADSDCEALETRWNSGAWSANPDEGLEPPEEGLRASIQIVNRELGTMYDINATVLQEFSDIVQHTSPGLDEPNLLTAHDAGTSGGITTARNCSHGTCIESTWPTPAEAVFAALTIRELRGEYTTEVAAGAAAEFLIHYPLRRYGIGPTANAVSVLLSDRSGNSIVQPCIPGPPYACSTSYTLGHNRPIEIVQFGNSPEDFGADLISDILGIPYESEFPDESGGFVSGSARLGFDGQYSSMNGKILVGTSVIGLTFQEFVNGNLQGEGGIQQRANYGGAAPMSETREIVDDG